MVAVITADLINSSNYKEEELTRVINVLQEEFILLEKKYGSKNIQFKMYRGDSFQGIILQPEMSLEIALQIKAAINRVHLKETKKSKAYAVIADLRLAIGIGDIEFKRESIAESNGQAFQFSGRTLDKMKNNAQKTKLKSSLEDIDFEINSGLFLLDTITDRWSTASAEVVYFLLKDLKEKDIAKELQISQSAVNQRKKASGWEAIAVFLKRYHHVIEKEFKNV